MPLTEKGEKIKGAMEEQYGPEKGESVFYASKNKGTITGVDAMSGSATPLVSATPAPAQPAPTTTAPTGLNTGTTPVVQNTPGPMPQADSMSVRDLARRAGGGDAWSPQAREAAAESRRAHGGGGGAGGGGAPPTDEEWHERIAQAQETYKNHPYYQGKTGPEGGQFGSVYSKPRDTAKPGSARDLARQGGAKQ